MSDIYTALSRVMADCDHVAKRDRNEHQRFMFRGIDAVVNAVGPVLRKHGVIVCPNVERVDYETVQTSTGKPATACRVLVTYSFYAGDGTSIDTRVAGEAWDSGDKACPKAMSVAFRTALLQALALPTDEPDPDGQIYERAPARTGEPPSIPQTTDNEYDAQADQPLPQTTDTTPLTTMTRRHMHALFNDLDIPDTQQLPGINKILGTEYESRKQLTEDDGKRIVAALAEKKQALR